MLGWPRERVRVIDDDLGKSGVASSDRRGFQTLIALTSFAACFVYLLHGSLPKKLFLFSSAIVPSLTSSPF